MPLGEVEFDYCLRCEDLGGAGGLWPRSGLLRFVRSLFDVFLSSSWIFFSLVRWHALFAAALPAPAVRWPPSLRVRSGVHDCAGPVQLPSPSKSTTGDTRAGLEGACRSPPPWPPLRCAPSERSPPPSQRVPDAAASPPTHRRSPSVGGAHGCAAGRNGQPARACRGLDAPACQRHGTPPPHGGTRGINGDDEEEITKIGLKGAGRGANTPPPPPRAPLPPPPRMSLSTPRTNIALSLTSLAAGAYSPPHHPLPLPPSAALAACAPAPRCEQTC